MLPDASPTRKGGRQDWRTGCLGIAQEKSRSARAIPGRPADLTGLAGQKVTLVTNDPAADLVHPAGAHQRGRGVGLRRNRQRGSRFRRSRRGRLGSASSPTASGLAAGGLAAARLAATEQVVEHVEQRRAAAARFCHWRVPRPGRPVLRQSRAYRRDAFWWVGKRQRQ